MRLVLDDPKPVTIPEIIDQIHELISEDRRISDKSIAEQLGMSREWVGSIIHEDLDMAEALRQVGPQMAERGSKRQRCQSSEQLSEIFFGAIQIISCRDW